MMQSQSTIRTTEGTANMELSRQWMSRPDDERFLDLDELYGATKDRADRSRFDPIRNKMIEVQAVDETPTSDLVLGLRGTAVRSAYSSVDAVPAKMTNWSFGQLCSRAKVPAGWARESTHPLIAADALNYGLQVKNSKDDVGLYSYENADGLEVRAATSTTYGRIYDHQVVDAIRELNSDGYWRIPEPTFYLKGEAGREQVAAESLRRKSTLYASDRDVWGFLTDQDRMVEVKRPDGGVEELMRGFYFWNSEVGASVFGIGWFLYRACCENRILWGTQDMRELRIRHTSGGPERFAREGVQVLSDYAMSSDIETVETVQRAMSAKVGSDDDEATTWLQKRRYTKAMATKIIARAKEEEGKAETVWDVVQGATALARGTTNADARAQAETMAGSLLNTV